MEEFKDLLVGTFSRLTNSRISSGFWVLIILSAVSIPFLTTFLDRMSEDDWTIIPAILLMLMVAALIWFLIFVSWQLTRATADYQDRTGAIWPWMGWTVLAYLPTIAVIIGVAIANDGADFSYPETIIFTLLPMLSAPLLVHASGRAIDAAGPPEGVVLSYWIQRYLPLVTAYMVMTVPATLVSEAIYLIAEQNLLVDVAASLAYLPAMILGTVLTVDAFHRLPQESPA